MPFGHPSLSRAADSGDAKKFTSRAEQRGAGRAKWPLCVCREGRSTLDLRQVKPGQRQDGDTTVIINGVKPGESVVTRGRLQLAPGMKVAVQEDKSSESQTAGARDVCVSS